MNESPTADEDFYPTVSSLRPGNRGVEAVRGTRPAVSLPNITLFLNNVIEQDHRFIKKRITASQGFRSGEGAWRTIEGYEAMHAIRNGQIRCVGKGDAVGQRQFIHMTFGIAA